MMNHDTELKYLGKVLKIVLTQFDLEIDEIKDPKHRREVVQEFEKAQHYMIKMTMCLDDLNTWLTAFGVDGNAKKDP